MNASTASRTLRLALAQLNPTLGDIAGNLEKARATRLVMISKTPRVLVETLIPRQSR